MSGRYMKLCPGQYMLTVPKGNGPAGVHRGEGGDVTVDRHGGQASFEVPDEERVYFWWRGPREPQGLRIIGPATMASRGRRRSRTRIA